MTARNEDRMYNGILIMVTEYPSITGFKHLYTVGTHKFNYLKDAKKYIDSMNWEDVGIKEN